MIYIRGVEEAASYGKVVLLRCYILPIIGYEFIIFMMHTHLTCHFSSVSTPEYRSGWDKIFGKPKIETAIVEPLSKYDQRKALVAEQWHKYQALKDPKHLAVICRELPFFDHPEVGDEIAKLLMDK